MTFAARHFWRRRGESDEHILQGSVRSEQRSLRQKGLPPGGLCWFWPLGFVAYRSLFHQRDITSLRLIAGQNQRNERHRIYAPDHI